jgi:hypothetical protein
MPMKRWPGGHDDLQRAAKKWSKAPSFKATDPGEAMGKFVLQLVTRGEEESHSMGSAFVVAPGIAITAAHVVDEMHKAHGFEPDENGEMTGRWLLIALQYVDGEARVWTVDNIVKSTFSDVAVLRLRGDPSWVDRERVRFTFRPPQVGERIWGVGYAGRARQAEDGTTEVSDGAHVSVGEVTEIFPTGRDKLLAPYPCFHVNCRFDDAQSGGPVFGIEGAVCGVISRSLPANGDDDEHTSVVAMIYPIVALSPNVDSREWKGEEPWVLYDYFRAVPGQVVDLHRVTREDDGSFTADMNPSPNDER